MGKWEKETNEAVRRVEQAKQDNRFRKSYNQIKTDFGMEIHNIEGSEMQFYGGHEGFNV